MAEVGVGLEWQGLVGTGMAGFGGGGNGRVRCGLGMAGMGFLKSFVLILYFFLPICKTGTPDDASIDRQTGYEKTFLLGHQNMSVSENTRVRGS